MAIPSSVNGNTTRPDFEINGIEPVPFEALECLKENIQPVPGGHSARALAQHLSSGSFDGSIEITSQREQQRQSFERELAESERESDDPLSVYERYARWALDAYPTAQATTSSPVLSIYERATQKFLAAQHYHNDPRYLRLWLTYIHLFADTPEEMYRFLARRGIGIALALYYEEFAGWLEGENRWNQARQVYELGISRQARPVDRLVRRKDMFMTRWEARVDPNNNGPSSPILSVIRPALVEKSTASHDEIGHSSVQLQGRTNGPATKSKMSVFTDTGSDDETEEGKNTLIKERSGDEESPPTWHGGEGLRMRKKENDRDPTSWTAAEPYRLGKKVAGSKLVIYKDDGCLSRGIDQLNAAQELTGVNTATVVNTKTGRIERAFVDFNAVYPLAGGKFEDGTSKYEMDKEYCFEELRAQARGWIKRLGGVSEVGRVGTKGWVAAASKNGIIAKEAKGEGSGVNGFESRRDEDRRGKGLMVNGRMDAVGDGNMNDENANPSRRIAVKSEGGATSLTQRTTGLSSCGKGGSINDENDENARIVTRGERDDGGGGGGGGENGDGGRRCTSKRIPWRDDGGNRTRKIKYLDIGKATEVVSTRGSNDTTKTVQVNFSTLGERTGRMGGGKSGEVTMTINTREAINEVYGMFNQPLKLRGVDELGQKGEAGEQEADYAYEEDEEVNADELGEREESEDSDGEYTYASEGDSIAASTSTVMEEEGRTGMNRLGLGGEGRYSRMGEFDEGLTGWSDFSEVEANEALKGGGGGDGDGDDNDDDERSKARKRIKYDWGAERMGKERNLEDYDSSPLSSPLTDEVDMETPWQGEEYRAGMRTRRPFMTPIVERTESSFGGGNSGRTKRLSRSGIVGSEKSRKRGRCWGRRESRGGEQDKGRDISATPCENREIEWRDGEGSNEEQREDGTGVKEQDNDALSKDENLSGLSADGECEEIDEDELDGGLKMGLIIDRQKCNPWNTLIHKIILGRIQPSLSMYKGYFDHSKCAKGLANDVRKAAQIMNRNGGSGRRSGGSIGSTVSEYSIRLEGSLYEYVIRRELGKGAYAPVYLAFRSRGNDLKMIRGSSKERRRSFNGSGMNGGGENDCTAIKLEVPGSAWEFYIISQARMRLKESRVLSSIVKVYEMHLYSDESYLVEEFCSSGTLLDVVNASRAENRGNNYGSGGVEEIMAMFFTVEILRSMEELHEIGIIHGDLKVDNVLLRLGNGEDGQTGMNYDLTSNYQVDGRGGWKEWGIKLIDFGRGIDMKVYRDDVEFIIENWDEPSMMDCIELREKRGWTYQIDYYGVAGIIHTLLFGKYLEVIESGKNGSVKLYKFKMAFKRYWQTEIWSEVVMILLNPVGLGEKLPCTSRIRDCRRRMEQFLVENGEKGTGLRWLLQKVEAKIKAQRR